MNCSYLWNIEGNLTNCSSLVNEKYNKNLSKENLYAVSTSIIVILSCLYGTISVVAVLGNSLVIWIVMGSHQMRSVINYFIANLALADVVIGLFAIPFQFQAALLQRWNLPFFMCAFCPFVQILTINVSIFTLTAIAIDRHRAVLNPLRAHPTKLRAKIYIAAFWIFSGMLATPMAIALSVIIIPEDELLGENSTTKPFCVNVNLSEKMMISYRLILFFIQYVIPLCIISVVYIKMGLHLWGSQAPGNAQDSRDANMMLNKRKVIKMLVIVVALFTLCWLPLQAYNFLQDIFPQINTYRYINVVWFCCDWLAMSNSCYNPFIYGIYNEKFKREFKRRFPCHERLPSIEGSYNTDLERPRKIKSRPSLHSSENTFTKSYTCSTKPFGAILIKKVSSKSFELNNTYRSSVSSREWPHYANSSLIGSYGF